MKKKLDNRGIYECRGGSNALMEAYVVGGSDKATPMIAQEDCVWRINGLLLAGK